tara:strand:- start:11846 stop:13807 length:1962 start_codon:yes stop_codon:yes gene_type:complete
MAERYVKVTEDMASNLDKVSQSLKDIGKLETSVLQGFVEITKSSTATGQAWTGIARFFSGTGFWQVQNKVKAIANLLQFQQKLTEKKIQQEEELTSQVAKTDKNLQTVLETQTALQGILDRTTSLEDRKAILNSKYFKVLQKRYGTRQAVFKLLERTNKAEKKAKEFNDALNKGKAKEIRSQFRKLELMEDEIGYLNSRSVLSKEEEERRDNLVKLVKDYNSGLVLSKDNIIQMNNEQLTLASQMQDYQQEYFIANDRYRELVASIASETDEKEKERLLKVKKELDEEKQRIRKEQKDLEDKLGAEGITVNKIGKDVKGFDSSGAKKPKGMLGYLEKMAEGTVIEKLFNAWHKKHLITLFLWRKKNSFLSLFRNPARLGRQIGMFLGKAITFFISFMVIGFLLIAFLVTLKSLGIFDYIVFIAKEIFRIGKVVMSVLGKVFAVFAVFITDLVQFISDLFSSDGNFVKSGGKLIMSGLAVVGTILMGVLEILGATIWSLLKLTFGIFYAGFKEQGGKFVLKLIGFGLVLFGMWKVTSFLIAAATSNGFVIAIGILLAGIMSLFSNIPGMAEGGIATGGLTMVGEKGPELVNLPSGSRVYSNQESRGIAGTTNNITVNVQGRVGASDAELRDIANKVGRLISLEVNRTTSSGTRI